MIEDSVVEALVERARYRGPTVSADQLIGLDACLRQLGGQLALVARPELASRMGIEASGTLLIGPPGTGKTSVARFLAGRVGRPLYAISADEFGGEPELLHAVFRRLASEPAVLYIDEVSILAQRRDWSDAGDRRMLSALLTSLDGLSPPGGAGALWVIGACTNDIQLDPAIHRSGRLGVVVEFAPPSESHRRDLLDLYLSGVTHDLAGGELDRLAEVSVGATGADIRDWVSQAASEALAEEATETPVIRYPHLERVIARRGFIAAEDRPGREPDWETSLHEAAHAVIAFACFGRDALAKAHVGWASSNTTIDTFSRGHFTMADDWLEANPPTNLTWVDHAAVSLAGACAEQEVLGWRRGAGPDIARATRLVLAQLEEGDPDFGPSRSSLEHLGSLDAGVGSHEMRSLTWMLAQGRFASCWERTSSLVRAHRPAIERLAHHLLEVKGTVTGDEIVMAIGPLQED